MTPHDQARALMRKAPRPGAIDTIGKAAAYKEAMAACAKQFKNGKCTEQAAQSIINRLTPFH